MGPRVAESGIRWAQISPDPHLPAAIPALIEAVAAAVQLAVVFLMMRSARAAPRAAGAAGVLLAVSIAILAGITGAGFNPVRGLGPDFVAGSYPAASMWSVRSSALPLPR